MAIRMDYTLQGIGGLAAYAAGHGRAQERKSKYALNILQQQQYLKARQQEMLQQRQWQVADTAQQRKWEKADTAQQRKWEEADTAQQRKWEVERQKVLDERQMNENRFHSLPPIPNDLKDPALRRDLEGKRAAIQDMLTSGRWDLSRPEVQAKVQEAIDSYTGALNSWEPPSQMDEWNRGVMYVDPNTNKAYKTQEEVPGGSGIPIINGQVSPLYQAEQQAKAKAEADKAKADAEAAKEQKRLEAENRKEANALMNTEAFQAKNSKLPYEQQFQKAMEQVQATRPPAGAAAGATDVVDVAIDPNTGLPVKVGAAAQASPAAPGWHPPMSLPGQAAPAPSAPAAPAPAATPAAPAAPAAEVAPTPLPPKAWLPPPPEAPVPLESPDTLTKARESAAAASEKIMTDWTDRNAAYRQGLKQQRAERRTMVNANAARKTLLTGSPKARKRVRKYYGLG